MKKKYSYPDNESDWAAWKDEELMRDELEEKKKKKKITL